VHETTLYTHKHTMKQSQSMGIRPRYIEIKKQNSHIKRQLIAALIDL